MKLASIVLYAGKSTRFKSDTSKILHPLCGKAMFAWPLDEVLSLGGDVIAVIGHQAEQVQSEISSHYDDKVSFAMQTEQKGTGHAVMVAIQKLANFKGTILVLCGDTPLLTGATLQKLIKLQQSAQCDVAMLTTTLENPTGYGRIVRKSDETIEQIIEENEANDWQKLIQEINPGIYAFDADFLRNALSQLKSSTHKGEYYITDVVNSAISIKISADEAIGINDRAQLADAEKILRKRINARWMRDGVTCVNPKETYIDDAVQLSSDITLEPGVRLLGTTIISNHVRIGAGSILNNTKVAEHAVIHPYSICDDAVIGAHAQIGPFARLRPKTRLDEYVKIGNFVEVKKSHFHTGAKANHLAYIGDAEIGEKSNIGAGTITCNYDGHNKHKTTIDDGVFIGSNSTLVAPLHIESQAYVAAGSTINRDVPSDALAIARGRQENKEGYAKKIRSRFS